MRKKKIDIPIYFGDLILIEIDDLSKLNNLFPKQNEGIFYDSFGAYTFKDRTKEFTTYIIAVATHSASPSLIAHECVHLVNHVFKDRGMRLCPVNDEPQAYLMGWVVNECHKFFALKPAN